MAHNENVTAEDIALELMEDELKAEQESEKGGAIPVHANPYVGIASAPFSAEAAEILMQEIPDVDIEIRPDGLIYLPEIKYRRILNRAFGPGAWSLLPIDITVSSVDNMLYYRGALFVHGRFVSEAIGEQQYFASNDRMSYATAAESAKSNCLTRCCKDLGIASELWDPSFVRRWIATHAVGVWCVNVGSNPSERGKKRKMWRKKDAPVVDLFPWREEESQQSVAESAPATRREAADRGVPDTSRGFQPPQKPASADATRITFRQAKRFHAIASEFGWSQEEVDAFLQAQGYDDPEQIRRSDYDRMCSTLEDAEVRAAYSGSARSSRRAKAA